MISSKQRVLDINLMKPIHMLQRSKERGYLFFGKTFEEIIAECFEVIEDPNRGIFIKDERGNKQSNYVLIFVSSNYSIVAIPCKIDEEAIWMITIKDVKNDESNPNWFINGYNTLAKQRGIEKLNLIPKINNKKNN